MSSSVPSDSDCTGRRKHLGELAFIFYHRGGTWKDFGDFLLLLWRRRTSSSAEVMTATRPPVHSDCSCRHNGDGQHAAELRAAALDPQNYPTMAHERYTRPCFGLGSWDKGKNPGLVADDYCTRARNYLSSIGKGQKKTSAEQGTYEPDSQMSGVSEVNSSERSSIDMPDVETDGSFEWLVEEAPAPPLESSQESTEFDGEDLFEDQDIVSALLDADDEHGVQEDASDPATRPRSSGTGISSLSDYPYSQASRGRGSTVARSSTKMRGATLAYLVQFADDPMALKAEFRRLRDRRDLWILHLCGCGICWEGPDGQARLGCCEPTHLRLGTSEENRAHTAAHLGINYVQPGMYARHCSHLHTALRFCDGLF